MTKATFDTEHYGKIEVIRDNGDGSYSGQAYFFNGDLGAVVDKDGTFKHIFTGTEFNIHWGRNKDNATLSVWQPKTIGTAKSTNY